LGFLTPLFWLPVATYTGSTFVQATSVVLKIYNMLLFFFLDTQYILFYGYLKIIVFITGEFLELAAGILHL